MKTAKKLDFQVNDGAKLYYIYYILQPADVKFLDLSMLFISTVCPLVRPVRHISFTNTQWMFYERWCQQPGPRVVFSQSNIQLCLQLECSRTSLSSLYNVNDKHFIYLDTASIHIVQIIHITGVESECFAGCWVEGSCCVPGASQMFGSRMFSFTQLFTVNLSLGVIHK